MAKYSGIEHDRTEATDDKGGYKHPREVNSALYRHDSTQIEHVDDKLGLTEHSERMTGDGEWTAEHEVHEYGDYDGHGGYFDYSAVALECGYDELGEFKIASDGEYDGSGDYDPQRGIKGGDKVRVAK